MFQVVFEAVGGKLAGDGPAGAAGAGAGGVAALDDKARDDAVEHHAVIELALRQLDEIGHRLGGHVGIQFEFHYRAGLQLDLAFDGVSHA